MPAWFEQVTIGDLLDRLVQRFGEREALTFAGQRWSFQQLQADSDRAARGLMQCGIQPGDKVALWLTNRPEWLHILFAVAKIGAVLVPINTRFRTTDVEYVLRQSNTRMLITTDHSGPIGYLDMVRELIPELATCTTPQALQATAFPELRQVSVVSTRTYPGTWRWQDAVAAGASVAVEQLTARQRAVTPDATVLIMYTSGTTVFPRV